VAFLLLFTVSVRAELTLELDKVPSVVDMAPFLDVLEDDALEFDGGDLLSHKFNAGFQPLLDGKASYGFSNSAWWVRFKVRNTGYLPLKSTVKLDYPLLDLVDVWVLSGTDQLASWRTGNRRSFHTRPIKHRDFLFPMTLAAKGEQTVYIRIQSEGPVNIGLTMFGEEALLPKIQLEYMALGAYFGAFLLLAICVSVLYLIDRQKAFILYLIYILSYSSYMLAFNGLAFQYLWPNAPEFGQISRPILLALSTIFLLQFSRALLRIRKNSKLLFQTVTALQAVLVAIMVVVPFFGYGAFVMPLAVILLTALGLVVAMGIVAHRKGEAAARYYLVAWSVFIVGVFLYLMKVFGLLPHNFITHYGFQIGSFFEFILLSAAVGVRVRELRNQSHIDSLTGLPNRRSFDLALAEEFSISTRPEAQLTLMVIDVDHFKRFNDQHGHAAGDRVLRELGEVLKQQVRRPGQAYRYGGEEFAVLLPRTGLAEGHIVAERLRERVAAELQFLNVTISIGVASYAKGHFSTASQFFVAADRALYAAKEAGRNRVKLSEKPEEKGMSGTETAVAGASADAK
jgi:diguanylate cyclase (GGDEF)-like protein